MNSKLIVIEGIDGTGKRTQSELLIKYLRSQSINAHLIGFPDYTGTTMGRTIGEMLAGKLGSLSGVHPYFSASLFALDRAEKRSQILSHLEAGDWVICDRYVYSNVAHQACRLRVEERQKFLEWVEHLEFGILGLPRADKTFLLSMEDEQSRVLREQRTAHEYSESVLDIHEADLAGMSNARAIYEQLAQNLNWTVINCSTKRSLRSIEEISNEICHSLQL